MNGTSTAVATSAAPNGKAASAAGLTPEARQLLNWSAQAFADARYQIVKLRVPPSYEWVDTLIRQANGEIIQVNAISQAFEVASKPERDRKAVEDALTAFAAGALYRVKTLASSAPADAEVVLSVWRNQLVSRATQFATQAAELTTGFDDLTGVTNVTTPGGNASASVAELQQSVKELNELIDALSAVAQAATIEPPAHDVGSSYSYSVEPHTDSTASLAELRDGFNELRDSVNALAALGSIATAATTDDAVQAAQRQAAGARDAMRRVQQTADKRIAALRAELRATKAEVRRAQAASRRAEAKAARAVARASARKK